MPITVIKGPDGVLALFRAYGTISQNRSIHFISGGGLSGGGGRDVEEAVSGYPERRGGVAAEGATSGQLVRIRIGGIASGVICASAVLPGVALQTWAASGLGSGTGHIAPLLSGIVPILGAGLGDMLGNALMSGGKGSGISILVDLG